MGPSKVGSQGADQCVTVLVPVGALFYGLYTLGRGDLVLLKIGDAEHRPLGLKVSLSIVFQLVLVLVQSHLAIFSQHFYGQSFGGGLWIVERNISHGRLSVCLYRDGVFAAKCQSFASVLYQTLRTRVNGNDAFHDIVKRQQARLRILNAFLFQALQGGLSIKRDQHVHRRGHVVVLAALVTNIREHHGTEAFADHTRALKNTLGLVLRQDSKSSLAFIELGPVLAQNFDSSNAVEAV